MDEPSEPQRVDARANRERILAVARTLFAATPDASLNAVAKAAEVGAGTLYRHFPNREALILALYRQEIAALVDLAPALAAAHPPLTAFELWCERLADYGRVKRGLTDVIHAVITARDHEETYWPMVGAVRHLLQAGVAAGVFRADADAEDVLLLLGFLWRPSPGPDAEARARRMLALVIDGLKAR